jgi:hypothetical protein
MGFRLYMRTSVTWCFPDQDGVFHWVGNSNDGNENSTRNDFGQGKTHVLLVIRPEHSHCKGLKLVVASSDSLNYKCNALLMKLRMWTISSQTRAKLVSAASALDADGVRAVLESDEFKSAWFKADTISDASWNSAISASRIGDRASTSLTPEADESLRRICMHLQEYGDWDNVENNVFMALHRGNIYGFRMPPRAPSSWSARFGVCQSFCMLYMNGRKRI